MYIYWSLNTYPFFYISKIHRRWSGIISNRLPMAECLFRSEDGPFH